MKVFLICGYGIPERLESDRNYLTYLNIVFNSIFSRARGQEAAIIVCGGHTSCTKPYTGTEADVIGKYIQKLMTRAETRESTKKWRLFMEDRSLSTLENLTFSEKIIRKEGWHNPITIFCEATREKRINIVGQQVFSSTTIYVVAIDFDISANRYLDPADIQKKEDLETQGSLWALEKPERMKAHHELFERKFALLRERDAEGVSHVEAVQEWYKVAPQWIAELMPGHPFLKK